jgi:hypothetical protein
VATRKGNNVLVAQTHLLAKDLPQVVRTWLIKNSKQGIRVGHHVNKSDVNALKDTW